jgi:hypothetical protein
MEKELVALVRVNKVVRSISVNQQVNKIQGVEKSNGIKMY